VKGGRAKLCSPFPHSIKNRFKRTGLSGGEALTARTARLTLGEGKALQDENIFGLLKMGLFKIFLSYKGKSGNPRQGKLRRLLSRDMLWRSDQFECYRLLFTAENTGAAAHAVPAKDMSLPLFGFQGWPHHNGIKGAALDASLTADTLIRVYYRQVTAGGIKLAQSPGSQNRG
jgi:hypothetical protein